MDPEKSAQDVLRCNLCKTGVAPTYCEDCGIYLCEECAGKHLADKSKAHKVVSLLYFLSTPKCRDHPTISCERHCEQCDAPICSKCIASKKHKYHDFVDVKENYQRKENVLKSDLKELENSILSKYNESANVLKIQKDDHRKHYQELTAALYRQGEALHKEINTILEIKQSEINDMDTKHMAALEKQEDAINQTIKEIKQVIQNLKSLLDTADFCLVSKYTSRNDEFKRDPPKLQISLPSLQPVKINRELLLQQFGSLSPASIEVKEPSNILPAHGAESSPPDRPLLEAPFLITELKTGSDDDQYSISSLGDEDIWIRGNDEFIKMYNLQGKILKSIRTKSGNVPEDITATRSGHLVYTDYDDRSINMVKKNKIKPLIRLKGWGPLGVCITSSDDLLVVMDSDDGKQTKVVRYSGSTEIQSIQWDDQGQPLYSSGYNDKYISENKNLDICVADWSARAVVVVSAAGKLRFRYTGPLSTNKKPFEPLCISTDSLGRILTADCDNHCIHILDKDGRFLAYIDNCGLQRPWGLCVDSKDNLIVAETNTGKVKKIQYYQ